MSKTKKKYGFFKRRHDEVAQLEADMRVNFQNFYYNLWMNRFKWNGLDEEVKDQQKNFIMRKFWCDGSVAARPIPHTDLLAWAPFVASEYNMYDMPTEVELVNTRKVSNNIIPKTPQVVNKDVGLVWAQPNHKGIQVYVNYLIERLIQSELVINTNLTLHKTPFVIGVTEENRSRMEDLLDRILHDEVAIFASVDDIQALQSLALNTPYIIDKLKAHSVSIHNEILTYLGIDNCGNTKTAQATVDEVNANNESINDSIAAIEETIKDGLANINRLFGRSISIEPTSKPVDSKYDRELEGNPNRTNDGLPKEGDE